MRAQFQKFYRQFPLLKEPNGCSRLFVSIIPSEGTTTALLFQADARLIISTGSIRNWMESVGEVESQPGSRQLVMRVEATQARMVKIVRGLDQLFDASLVHMFQINFYGYSAACPFMSDAYWAAKEAIPFNSAEEKLRQFADIKNIGEEVASTKKIPQRSRSDSPGGVIALALSEGSSAHLEPWRGERVQTPSPVDTSLFIWSKKTVAVLGAIPAEPDAQETFSVAH